MVALELKSMELFISDSYVGFFSISQVSMYSLRYNATYKAKIYCIEWVEAIITQNEKQRKRDPFLKRATII